MSLNQSLISDFSEYYRLSQRTKIKYKLHYGPCEKVQDGQSFRILVFYIKQKTYVIEFTAWCFYCQNLINDVIKCCHYNDTFYYVI